jgi:hypothetical protein
MMMNAVGVVNGQLRSSHRAGMDIDASHHGMLWVPSAHTTKLKSSIVLLNMEGSIADMTSHEYMGTCGHS